MQKRILNRDLLHYGVGLKNLPIIHSTGSLFNFPWDIWIFFIKLGPYGTPVNHLKRHIYRKGLIDKISKMTSLSTDPCGTHVNSSLQTMFHVAAGTLRRRENDPLPRG